MFVVLEKFRCNLTIKIESRKAYDGAIYHDIDAREKWEKMERESKIEWEEQQKKNTGKEETDHAIKAAAVALARRQEQLETKKRLVKVAIERTVETLSHTGGALQGWLTDRTTEGY